MIYDHTGQDWSLSEKGRKDAERHRDKIVEEIRKKASGVIAEENIITSKGGKKVRIPIRGLKDYKFVYRQNDEKSGGIGQGDGKPGDVVGREQKKNQPGQPGQPGNGEGDGGGDMEVEVDIDYLIKLIFEDLGLPYIEEKTLKTVLVPKGWKFDAIVKKGIFSQVNKKRTLKEAIQRNMAYSFEVQDATGCSEDDSFRALQQTKFDVQGAIDIVKKKEVDQTIDPNGIFVEDDDMRFNRIEEEVEYQSKCVVLALIDSSGSMGRQKKFLCRTLLFWLVRFLEKMYESVKIRFIIHTTEAHVVNEEEFFRQGEDGGTACHTAIDLADYLIETEYPLNEWNAYVFYSGDGEDFYPDRTMKSIQKLLDRKINMFAYTEILPEEEAAMGYGYWETLMKYIKNTFPLSVLEEHGTQFYKNNDLHLLACKIMKREHIVPALKHFLFTPKEGK